MDQSFLPWLVPLFPLLGFLFNALAGARLTGSPLPIVETDDHGAAARVTDPEAADAGPSDGPEATHGGVATSGHDAHSDARLNKGGQALVGGVATLMVLLSFVVALMLFVQVLNGPQDHKQIFSAALPWMDVQSLGSLPSFSLDFRLLVDPLSSLMLLIITGVGTLIHLYSMGYMGHDKGYARYFTYLNLFVFFMLLLVMGSNLGVLFIGWEGVGLASYLLIGFWYERKSATNAGKKAFIVNRIGDCALLIALFLIFKYFHTLEFFGTFAGQDGILTTAGLNAARAQGYLATEAGTLSIAAATLVPLLLFFGAAGKSAQIPLYVWLPDAMEGPTPVSALIHAATMVTGGVYLVARAHALFLLSPPVMTIVAVIGLSTAFLAATIALVQTDIKRVLAYSTVSQLGYMFLACGVGAFSTAMFHVTTHAFFKALLFLGAGSVIHAMGGEQDMRRMGGLGGKIKTTWLTMLIGTLAIAGIPPLAGFWSKDEILLNAFADSSRGGLGHWSLWLGGFIVSGLTAFYMVRLMMKTFAGSRRFSDEVDAYVHESPPSMTLPLWILAGLSIVGGFINAVPFFGFHGFENFLEPSLGWREAANVPFRVEDVEKPLLIASALLAIIVALGTRMAYINRTRGELSTDAQKRRSNLWRLLDSKWGVDEFYNAAFVRPGRDLSRFLWRVVDRKAVGGTVNGVGGLIVGLAQGMKGWQSGFVRNYALSMLVGVIAVIIGCLLGMNGWLR